MPDDDFQLAQRARKLFAKPCAYFWSAAMPDNLPPVGAPEICFLGRSNVGKSSLLNALVGQNALARVSTTPGRTQELNFFALGVEASRHKDTAAVCATSKLTLVDMPGYGYAAVAKAKSEGWQTLIKSYLQGRPALLRALVLVDCRRGLGTGDAPILDLLDRCAVSYQIILTKCDALDAPARAVRLESTHAALKKRPAAYPDICSVSVRDSQGVDALRLAIARLLSERGVLPAG